MDYVRKTKLYQETGVREYWIVDPNKEMVTVYHENSGMCQYAILSPSGFSQEFIKIFISNLQNLENSEDCCQKLTLMYFEAKLTNCLM